MGKFVVRGTLYMLPASSKAAGDRSKLRRLIFVQRSELGAAAAAGRRHVESCANKKPNT